MHLEQVEVKWNKRDMANVQQEVANRVASWVATELAIWFGKDKFIVFNILATGKWFNEKQNKINQVTDFHNGQGKENYLSKKAVLFLPSWILLDCVSSSLKARNKENSFISLIKDHSCNLVLLCLCMWHQVRENHIQGIPLL